MLRYQPASKLDVYYITQHLAAVEAHSTVIVLNRSAGSVIKIYGFPLVFYNVGRRADQSHVSYRPSR
jgi:hypothetical protein